MCVQASVLSNCRIESNLIELFFPESEWSSLYIEVLLLSNNGDVLFTFATAADAAANVVAGWSLTDASFYTGRLLWRLGLQSTASITGVIAATSVRCLAGLSRLTGSERCANDCIISRFHADPRSRNITHTHTRNTIHTLVRSNTSAVGCRRQYRSRRHH